MSLLIQLDRVSETPLFAQIVLQVRRMIETGALQAGERLPPSRVLAERIGVDRSTVLIAYNELQALGFTSSRQGGYTTVARRRPLAADDPGRGGEIDWQEAVNGEVEEIYQYSMAHAPESLFDTGSRLQYNLATIELDPRLYPLADVRRSMREVLTVHGAEALRYGDPKGCPTLRELLARRLRQHGIAVSAAELLITNGAQQGIDLVSRVLGRPGASALVELPTYASVLPLLRLNGLRVLGINMMADGADIEELARLIETARPEFIYTMPSFQNPTGLTSSHEHRERLYSLALRHRIPIVEDGFEEDMKYEGPVALPIKSIDNGAVVIYLGTFSKVLFPGLRIGWIAAERPLIERLTAVKRFTDLGCSTLGQLFMEQFCREGYYDRHLQRVHRILRRRMRRAMKAAGLFFPSDLQWTRPAGGYTIWLKLPGVIESDELNRRTREVGVAVSPGGAYFPDGGPSAFVRLSIARHNETELIEAFRLLGKVLKAI